MICIQNSRAERLQPRIGRPVTIILASLVLTAGEAMACPYHNFGGPQRFGPFDAAGGWRSAQDGFDVPAFDTGPTAAQLPVTRQSEAKPDIKAAAEKATERRE